MISFRFREAVPAWLGELAFSGCFLFSSLMPSAQVLKLLIFDYCLAPLSNLVDCVPMIMDLSILSCSSSLLSPSRPIVVASPCCGVRIM